MTHRIKLRRIETPLSRATQAVITANQELDTDTFQALSRMTTPGGMGCRFKVRRLSLSAPSRNPWAVLDRTNRHAVRSYPTHARAMSGIDAILAAETIA